MESVLFFVLLGLVLFFVFREVFCWYGKVNLQVSLQKRILIELMRQNGTLTSEAEVEIKFMGRLGFTPKKTAL